MRYQDQVAAAAAALKRGEDANWELARLTYENTLSHNEHNSDKVTMRRWCADVRAASVRRFSETTGERYKRAWRDVIRQGLTADLPSWSEAYDAITPDGFEERMAPSKAKAVLAHGTPETKRQVARELLDDPDVTADPDIQESIVSTAGSNPSLTARTIERAEEQRPAPPKPERDPNQLDYIAALGVGDTAILAMRKLHSDVSTLVAVLRNENVRLDEGAREAIQEDVNDLRQASEIARMYSEEIQIALEGGISDERLKAFTEGS